MKDVKIVIGANYGDEGKGLMTRYFVQEAKEKDKSPIVILYNGSAQRGHTVNYDPSFHHVYHHFGSGAGDLVPTYFGKYFRINPLEYAREYEELKQYFDIPQNYCDRSCLVITPFDMLADQVTKIWIEQTTGQKSYGTCGMGTWCAYEDRSLKGRHVYTIQEYKTVSHIRSMLKETWKQCLEVLYDRGVEISEIPGSDTIFSDKARDNAIEHFIQDLKLFFKTTTFTPYTKIWNDFDYHIFEGGAGLGLSYKYGQNYTTTSYPDLFNPYFSYIKGRKGAFNAEVCYVSRTYLTRHGDGPLENELSSSKELNSNIVDPTNEYNKFQGPLRYGLIDRNKLDGRIAFDFKTVEEDPRFYKTFALTHCNEYTIDLPHDYYSDHKCRVYKNDR